MDPIGADYPTGVLLKSVLQLKLAEETPAIEQTSNVVHAHQHDAAHQYREPNQMEHAFSVGRYLFAAARPFQHHEKYPATI